MSLENIINQINIDTKKEVDNILKDAKLQSNKILKESNINANRISKEILIKGEKKSESIKRIIISKEKQKERKKLTQAKEDIIDQCFEKAYLKFKNYNDKKYEELISKFINNGLKVTGVKSKVIITKEIDKKIVKKFDLEVIGKTKSIGGIILKSNDNKITLDNTIEGIMKREKNRIRIDIGKILFS
jgi:vacuolar-type H+-ATPase subunit E/Vma4